ncbi:MAG TPA: N-acetyl-gamma-glutamyl-phosphate reductase [Gemmatimonadaceae bacterium]
MGVLGASGYAGRELCALLVRHPGTELAFACANEQRGATARFGNRSVTFLAHDDAPLDRAQLVFSALPHGASKRWVDAAHAAGAKVVDLSADLRPGGAGDAALVPYGLTELARDEVRAASVVANPGCYATAVLLALLPLLVRGLIAPGGCVSVAAASGVTGAGITPRPDLMFAEVSGDYRPYALGNTHRHLAEMRAVMRALDCDADLVFTPHLLPVARGILATITVPLAEPLANPLDLWRAHYASEPFVEITDQVPALRDVVHRNIARIAAHPAAGVRHPTVIVVAAIDNLVKGAAGQAIQNGNLLAGLDEAMGLPA